MTTSPHLQCAIEDGLMTLCLDRPAKRHALDAGMYQALREALEQAAGDDSVRVVQLTASGDYFCAGNDREGFARIADIPHRERPGFRFMNTLAAFPKPVVAAVPGDAVGIGVTLLLHCDLVYLARNCVLRLPFASIGLVPEFASTTLLPGLLGQQKATELLFLKQQLAAEEAVALGLANAALAPDELRATAQEACAQLAALPARALLHGKRLLKQPGLPAVLEKIEQETLAINALLPDIRLGRA